MSGEVRPEYARLAGDFVRLAAMFGITLDATSKRDVATFAASLEWVDRVMDAMPTRVERERFGAQALEAATYGGAVHETITALHEVLVRRRVVEPFARLVEEELVVGEAVREAIHADAFMACVAREGALTTEMTLLVSGLASHTAFARFFRVLGEPANFVDKLLDVRQDYARGEIRLRPTLLFQARIAREIVRRLPRLVSSSPRPAWVIAWGATYLGHYG
jgi:hypothetical protein